MKQLRLGYAPWGEPYNKSPIYPFDSIFTGGHVDLAVEDDLSKVDAVLLWGGEDISPSLYNEKRILNSGPAKPSFRDMFEWHVIKDAIALNLPIIGVCRGAQMACIAAGGNLIQHVNNHNCGNHTIKTYDNDEMLCTSAHHQMMGLANVTHEMLAWTPQHLATVYQPDTVAAGQLDKRLVKEPEVVYFNEINAVVCQGHPEWMDRNTPFVKWFLEQIVFFQLSSITEK